MYLYYATLETLIKYIFTFLADTTADDTSTTEEPHTLGTGKNQDLLIAY